MPNALNWRRSRSRSSTPGGNPSAIARGDLARALRCRDEPIVEVRRIRFARLRKTRVPLLYQQALRLPEHQRKRGAEWNERGEDEEQNDTAGDLAPDECALDFHGS
jgi:hypothetical protein